MKHTGASTRMVVGFVTIVTLILLIGSVILSRIVFKADVPSSAVYLSPATLNVEAGGVASVDVLANFSAVTELAGAQLTLKYDSQLLEFVSATPAPTWRTVKSVIEPGQLLLVLLPSDQTSISLPASQAVAISNLRFHAVKTGSSTLSFVPTTTILATLGSSVGRAVVNSVASVQDAQITAGTARSDTTASDQIRLDASSQNEAAAYTSQRIIGDQTLLAASSAFILVALQQPARITVRFGPTKVFGNTVNYTNLTKQAAVKINGLAAGQRYFYQVVASASNGANQTLGQIQSFQLPELSDQKVVDHASLTIFPTQTSTTTTAYALLYDANNKVITDLAPKFSAEGPAVQFGFVSDAAGLYQAPLNVLTTSKQTVSTQLTLDGRHLAGASVLIDPNINAPQATTIVSTLANNQKTLNLILALVGALILLGLAFYKLNRIK